MPLLLAALVDPFVNFKNWPTHVLESVVPRSVQVPDHRAVLRTPSSSAKPRTDRSAPNAAIPVVVPGVPSVGVPALGPSGVVIHTPTSVGNRPAAQPAPQHHAAPKPHRPKGSPQPATHPNSTTPVVNLPSHSSAPANQAPAQSAPAAAPVAQAPTPAPTAQATTVNPPAAVSVDKGGKGNHGWHGTKPHSDNGLHLGHNSHGPGNPPGKQAPGHAKGQGGAGTATPDPPKPGKAKGHHDDGARPSDVHGGDGEHQDDGGSPAPTPPPAPDPATGGGPGHGHGHGHGAPPSPGGGPGKGHGHGHGH